MVRLPLREERWDKLVVPSSVLFFEMTHKLLQKIFPSKGEGHA